MSKNFYNQKLQAVSPVGGTESRLYICRTIHSNGLKKKKILKREALVKSCSLSFVLELAGEGAISFGDGSNPEKILLTFEYICIPDVSLSRLLFS